MFIDNDFCLSEFINRNGRYPYDAERETIAKQQTELSELAFVLGQVMEGLFVNCMKHPQMDDEQRMSYLVQMFDESVHQFINKYSAYYLRPTIAFYKKRMLAQMFSYRTTYTALKTIEPFYLKDVAY